MGKLNPKRVFRNYDTLELQGMDSQEDGRQIKALPPASNHPVNLDHTG
jgi:hypothetical protein